MADEVMDPQTGETVDPAQMTDRQLLEGVYRQNAAILQALVDVLGATEALQRTTTEVLKAARGEGRDKTGKSPMQVVEEFKASIATLVGAVREVPDLTADKVDGRLEDTLVRALGGAPPEGAAVQ